MSKWQINKFCVYFCNHKTSRQAMAKHNDRPCLPH